MGERKEGKMEGQEREEREWEGRGREEGWEGSGREGEGIYLGGRFCFLSSFFLT